jgi:hypothetical protein
MRAEGIVEQFRLYPHMKAEVDEGYRGLANEFPDQVSAPPRKPKNLGEGAITEQYGWRQAKRRQSSQRIAVEHANAELRARAPSEEAPGEVQGNPARARWEGVKGATYPGLAFNIRSITSAPVVITGRRMPKADALASVFHGK